MASNLECVGLGVTDRAGFAQLVEGALPHAQVLGEVSGGAVLRWQDRSGARLVIGVRGREVVDLLPSFAGATVARLANVHVVNDEVAIADVLDDDGKMVTKLAVELEQRWLLAAVGPWAGLATVVALGVDVRVYADAAAFGSSDDSLLAGHDSRATEPAAHAAGRGPSRPLRMAAESVVSYGVFGPGEQAQAHARMYGTVLSAQQRTVQATGHQFTAARVRTAGFDVDMCLPPTQMPTAGNVVGGTVFLTASLQLTPSAKPAPRFRWRRKK